MKIDIIFSLPKTVVKKAKEALPRDLKETYAQQEEEPEKRGTRGQALSWGVTSDVPVSWSTEPFLCAPLAISAMRLSSQLDQSCSLLLCV